MAHWHNYRLGCHVPTVEIPHCDKEHLRKLLWRLLNLSSLSHSHRCSQNQYRVYLIRFYTKAIETGPTGPAAPGPIFGQPTRAKMLYMSFGIIDHEYVCNYGGNNNKERRKQSLVLNRNCCNWTLSIQQQRLKSICRAEQIVTIF